MQMLDSMMEGLIAQKQYHGFSRLPNGLFEDCTGQVFTLDVAQSKTLVGKGLDASERHDITFKMKPVNVMGRV